MKQFTLPLVEDMQRLTLRLGRVEKRKLCDTARQSFVWQGSEGAVVATRS